MNREEKDLTEYRNVRFGFFPYCPTLISSIEVLTKCIASCNFSDIILVMFSNFNGVYWF